MYIAIHVTSVAKNMCSSSPASILMLRFMHIAYSQSINQCDFVVIGREPYRQCPGNFPKNEISKSCSICLYVCKGCVTQQKIQMTQCDSMCSYGPVPLLMGRRVLASGSRPWHKNTLNPQTRNSANSPNKVESLKGSRDFATLVHRFWYILTPGLWDRLNLWIVITLDCLPHLCSITRQRIM